MLSRTGCRVQFSVLILVRSSGPVRTKLDPTEPVRGDWNQWGLTDNQQTFTCTLSLFLWTTSRSQFWYSLGHLSIWFTLHSAFFAFLITSSQGSFSFFLQLLIISTTSCFIMLAPGSTRISETLRCYAKFFVLAILCDIVIRCVRILHIISIPYLTPYSSYLVPVLLC